MSATTMWRLPWSASVAWRYFLHQPRSSSSVNNPVIFVNTTRFTLSTVTSYVAIVPPTLSTLAFPRRDGQRGCVVGNTTFLETAWPADSPDSAGECAEPSVARDVVAGRRDARVHHRDDVLVPERDHREALGEAALDVVVRGD